MSWVGCCCKLICKPQYNVDASLKCKISFFVLSCSHMHLNLVTARFLDSRTVSYFLIMVPFNCYIFTNVWTTQSNSHALVHMCCQGNYDVGSNPYTRNALRVFTDSESEIIKKIMWYFIRSYPASKELDTFTFLIIRDLTSEKKLQYVISCDSNRLITSSSWARQLPER